MSLTQKTVSGLLWSFADDVAKLGVTFLSGIILARLLTPRDYGLIGMTTLFIAVSQSFINSGFRQALIRKQDCTEADFSTVFYFNLLISILLYLVLFFLAGPISRFFEEPQLAPILQVLGVRLILSALSLVQQTKLTRAINFKLQTRISLVSSISSGIVGISMAYAGHGVWSLVASSLSGSLIALVLLWLWNDWRPALVFSLASFRAMFAFGSRLLMSGLLNTVYNNLSNLVIGKCFSTADLGYYTRATLFETLPSQHLMGVIQRVSYPILATLQDDIPRLRAAYRTLLQNTMLVTFVLMLGMAAVAEPLIVATVGEQWRPSIVYLQLLSFVGIFYPLQAINLNMLQVQGRSDLLLKLEVMKKALAAPVILAGVLFGIKAMILTMLVHALMAYHLDAYWSGKLIGYTFVEQVKDILPSFGLAAAVALAVYAFGQTFTASDLMKLILQVTVGVSLTIGAAEMLRLDNYLTIKTILLDKTFQTVASLKHNV
jgi:teichuronic acid exporter